MLINQNRPSLVEDPELGLLHALAEQVQVCLDLLVGLHVSVRH